MRSFSEIAARYTTRILTSTDVIYVLWWFATLLITSCIFKLQYMKSVLDVRITLYYLFEPKDSTSEIYYFFSLFFVDVIEIFFIVFLTCFIGKHLLRLNIKTLILVTTPLLLLVAGANLMSFEQLRTPLTLETVLISLGWALTDSNVVRSFIPDDIETILTSSRLIAPAAAIMAWCALPCLFSRIRRYHHAGDQDRLRIWSTYALVALLIAAAGAMSLVDRPLSATWWWIVVMVAIVTILASHLSRHRLPWSGMASWLRPCALAATALLVAFSGLLYAFGGVRDFEPTPLALKGHWSTLAASLLSSSARDYEDLPVLSADVLRQRYRSLAYPKHDGSIAGPLLTLPSGKVKPRHMVVVSLETAFQKHYRLFDDPDLPRFHRMSQRALVSEKHQTVAPFTVSAAFSMLSGLYPRLDVDERFKPDSLPHVLARHDYVSSYIDAYLIDWIPGTKQNRRVFDTLGFDHLYDAATVPGLTGDGQLPEGYQRTLRQEEAAFERALAAVRDAEAEEHPALVFVQSALGHFPWQAKPGHENDPPEDKIRAMIEELDRLFGILLDGLDEDGLTDEVIIVIAGDHGLRHVNEFDSLGYRFAHSDIAFNVPLIISAPSLLDGQVQVPYVTSHIDLAPTLLAMTGIPTDTLFHHGETILDREISQRVTFMMNTNLSPVDGFHWNGRYVTYDHMTGVARLAVEHARSDERPLADALEEGTSLPASIATPHHVIDTANEVFDLSIAHFMRPAS